MAIVALLADGRPYVCQLFDGAVREREEIGLFDDGDEWRRRGLILLANWQDAKIGEHCVMECEYNEPVSRGMNEDGTGRRRFKPAKLNDVVFWQRVE